MLVARGVECVHVRELDMAQSADSLIWRHAIAREYIIISKDQDFRDLAIRTNGQCRMIWIRTGNCRVAKLLDLVSAAWSEIVIALESGETIVELRD